MRRFFMLVVATTTAALSLVGCSSDSDGGSSNNGGSGGGSVSQCVSNNAEFTSAEFVAQTEPGKACSASDASTVCESDMPLIVGTCGRGCLTMGDDAQKAACVTECIQHELTDAKSEPLSDGCVACYTADVACASANCLGPCVTPTSDACAQCRIEKGCAYAFYDCSGLPEPGVPGGGGEGGS